MKTLAGLVGLVIAVGSANANVITNGNFETGDLTGWTLLPADTGSTVSSTLPLDGIYSAVQVPGTNSQLSQSFTAITGSVTTSFIFSATDPGGASDRSMNVTWRGADYPTTSNQINLRLVDLDADGDGDVQIFSGIAGDGGSWQTVLTDAVTFGASTSLSLTINSYGVGANYDLTVGSSTAPGLAFFQNGPFADFAQLSFVNSSLASGSSVKFDNVSVVSAAPAAPFVLTITPNGANYDFTWNSQTGKTYDLVSSTDLSTAPAIWPVWDGKSGIAGTGEAITLTNIPGDGPQRFFSVLEK